MRFAHFDQPTVGGLQVISRRIMLGHGVAASFLLPGPGGAAQAIAARQRSAAAGSKPLVALDPGHGGKDPGAIGVSGTYEKHIALATARLLQAQLEASGRYRVTLTRESDVFIPLEQRVAIAQQRAAALFVSMHADALTDHSIRGASVYTLSHDASDAQTAALAQRENRADQAGGLSYAGVSPEVAGILASLVRQETRQGSARMANRVVGELKGNIPMLINPARHAAFVVLKAADIPSVLVEMGFMSNPQDEAALQTAPHRVKVAAAMKRAVDAYFAQTGPSLNAG